MKKIFSKFLTMSVIAVSLFSCGKKEASTNNDENKVVTLRFMGYNPKSSRVTYLKYLEEKLPNIKIDFEFVPVSNFDNILNTQLQAGQGPDIMELGGETKLLANANYLLDLTNQDFVSKYNESGIKPFTVNGKVYATPLQSWFEGIFYNKKIFKENNIQVPKTWEDFIAIHTELRKKGIKPETMGAQSYEPMMKQSIGVVNNLFYSNPANKNFDDLFNEGKAKLSEAWLPAVTEWYQAIQKGALTKSMLGMSYDQAQDEFASGKAAMWESGPWAVNSLMQKNPNLELGMFPIPGNDPNKAGWLVGGPGSALAINANSKHIKQALEVLNLTATKEAQLALIKDNAGSSFLKGVDVNLGDIYKDCEAAFKEGHIYAPWTAVWTNGNAVTQAYGKALQEVLAGTKTVKQALEDADKTNEQLLKAVNNK